MPDDRGHYYFNHGLSCLFEMPTSDARRLIPSHLQPLEVQHERSVLSVTVFDFCEGDGGALSAFVSVVDGPWAVGAEITTPWVTLPDFIEAECVVKEGFSYLEITVLADPSDPRIDDIGGDIPALPAFGLHVIDANLGMGDLVEIVARQAEAYASDR